MLDAHVIDVEASCKRDDYLRYATRYRAGQTAMPTSRVLVRRETWTAVRTAAARACRIVVLAATRPGAA